MERGQKRTVSEKTVKPREATAGSSTTRRIQGNGKASQQARRGSAQKSGNRNHNQYCSSHGKNRGHSSENCWKLHPELRPDAEKAPRSGSKHRAKGLTNPKIISNEIYTLARDNKLTPEDIIDRKIDQLKTLKAEAAKQASNVVEHKNIEPAEKSTSTYELTDSSEESSSDDEPVQVLSPVTSKWRKKITFKKLKVPSVQTKIPKKKHLKRKVVELDDSDEDETILEEKAFQRNAKKICEDPDLYKVD